MSKLSQFVVPLLWLAWLIYWIVAGRDTKAVQRREHTGPRLAYQLPLLAGMALLLVPHITMFGLDRRFVPSGMVTDIAAIAIVAAGLGFACAARVALGRNWSSTVTLKVGHELIRSGPYRLARHPIYTGLLLALIGTAVSVGKWRALVALALIIVSMIIKMRSEERFMTEQFGDSYRRYQAEVPALIPMWRKG